MSVASTAGWVISVCISCWLRVFTAAGSSPSMKMYERQGPPQQRGHHPVRLVEGRLDHGLLGGEGLEHVDVLRALPGVEEGDLGGRAAPEEDALLAQQPERGGVARGERVGELGRASS